MPAKPKSSAKATVVPVPKAAAESAPATVQERALQRFYQTNPVTKRVEEVGLAGLTPAEKKTYTHANLVLPAGELQLVDFSSKTAREFWKQVQKESLPSRHLDKNYRWGTDRSGRDIGTYPLEDFHQRSLKQARLSALELLSHRFKAKQELSRLQGAPNSEEAINDEKKRRRDMAELRRELYGEMTSAIAMDPTWDDVVPIPQDEPEDALAQIAYPDDYAEAVSYLRAVMAAGELSPRCLRLTEHVISMNPAHYTVWLYRFKIVTALQLPVAEELEWLNEVALANLKNYQIWHHRQLLLDHHYPTIAEDDDAVKALAKSETAFLSTILGEDTKNYHVWSYRHYLVGKLNLWTISELLSTQNLIEDDLRNNSAWSHRFFIVFDDPKLRDAAIPDDLLDREVQYAKDKILLAPQNQSSWNYIRGALTRGKRPLSALQDFAEQFISNLGAEEEDVRSSHALELLADVYAETEPAKAKLCLQRLGEKWDPVREGYWKYKASQIPS
ncbi:hypothetical protein B0I35DRAFT_237553 [Stachybotrys elegans]|uniref:Protein farnesyltransferase/geranylgeranyltransferase type-1 subunit alpha n=1 Tax=Stachybotrys elegans TaxID=80388 RepID=A0A8K0WS81_9HYPO|nr:hypothetical protein B0I35DRAFT_237553 [Stachybotrys elegans]